MTTEDEPLLDRARIQELFRQLGERLQKRGVIGDIYVIGGAAIALAYDSRRATRDIDAIFKPHGIVLDEARALAAEQGLPSWWLNEQASAYVAPAGDPDAPRTFDHPGLRVLTASPEHLLAMKAMAARRRDTEDLRLLVAQLGLSTTEQVVDVCRRVFPDETLPDRARLLLDDLFDQDGQSGDEDI